MEIVNRAQFGEQFLRFEFLVFCGYWFNTIKFLNHCKLLQTHSDGLRATVIWLFSVLGFFYCEFSARMTGYD